MNLIGEHIDYHGFGVLPVATESDVIIVSGPGGDDSGCPVVHVVNTDSDRYAQTTWPVSFPGADETIADHRGRAAGRTENVLWADYIACGVLGAMEHIRLQSPTDCPALPPCSLRMAVSGTVPVASGLSSSSALVCAALIAALQSWREPLPYAHDLAARAAACERFVGTMGGGMDQAASILSVEGCALLVEFQPQFSSKPVPLPEDAVFVVGISIIYWLNFELGS